jgi:hypothetical protein
MRQELKSPPSLNLPDSLSKTSLDDTVFTGLKRNNRADPHFIQVRQCDRQCSPQGVQLPIYGNPDSLKPRLDIIAMWAAETRRNRLPYNFGKLKGGCYRSQFSCPPDASRNGAGETLIGVFFQNTP